MIIVRIWEGLGNQLFQYAYARSLQERTPIPVYLDIRHCNKGDLPFEKQDVVERRLGLQHFNISLKKIKSNKIEALDCIDGKSGVIDKAKYLLLKHNIGRWRIIDDKSAILNLNPDILNPKDFTYISAHCVNKGYYGRYRDILLQELRLRKELILSENFRDIMTNRNTVSIHIRLTDYLNNPSFICKQSYYDKAIRYIREKVDEPYFIVFTDDPIMAKERFDFGKDIFWIHEEGYSDYEELVIMSKCKHNIIAYSTFSYWGAWLNQNREKLVIAPRHLFGDRLYEKGWMYFS